MKLLKSVGTAEVKRLVYAKYLLHQGRRFLDNNMVESYFNISVILIANSVEILCQTISYCLNGKDVSDKPISKVISALNNELNAFPYGEFDKVIKARNQLYHGGVFHTYGSCADFAAITEGAFKGLYSDPLAVDYSTISLVDLVKDPKVKEPLKRSEHSLVDNDFGNSVISACEAFALFEHRLHHRASKQISSHDSDLFWDTEVSWSFLERKLVMDKRNIVVGKLDTDDKLRILAEHIEEQVNKKIVNLARRFDLLLLLGDLYEDYKHFERIRPLYHMTLGGFRYKEEEAERRGYRKEDAEFIFNFVLNAVINIESKLNPIQIRSMNGTLWEVIE